MLCTSAIYNCSKINCVATIVKTVNTLYPDSNNLSAARLRDHFVALEIIPVIWPEC